MSILRKQHSALRFGQRHRDQHLTEQQFVECLQAEFSARLGTDWTLYPEEAAELLSAYPAEVVLETLRQLGKHLAREIKRNHRYQQEEIMQMVNKYVHTENEGTTRRLTAARRLQGKSDSLDTELASAFELD